MNDQKYNGWTNYETWLVNLHLSNDQGLSESITWTLQDVQSSFGADAYGRGSDALKAATEELLPLDSDNLFASDLLNAALGEVDWYEIAQNWMDELTEADAADREVTA